MLTETTTARQPAQMVWAAVWLDDRGQPRRSELIIMERDPNAPNSGYTSQSYIQALRQGLLPHWRRSQLFMHDNAPIHKARMVVEFIEKEHITPIEWPAYSPDLNPIEHLWWVLKKRVYTYYPQYNRLDRTTEQWEAFCEALKKGWREIPGQLITRLIESMPRRIDACTKARGWQTKY